MALAKRAKVRSPYFGSSSSATSAMRQLFRSLDFQSGLHSLTAASYLIMVSSYVNRLPVFPGCHLSRERIFIVALPKREQDEGHAVSFYECETAPCYAEPFHSASSQAPKRLSVDG